MNFQLYNKSLKRLVPEKQLILFPLDLRFSGNRTSHQVFKVSYLFGCQTASKQSLFSLRFSEGSERVCKHRAAKPRGDRKNGGAIYLVAHRTKEIGDTYMQVTYRMDNTNYYFPWLTLIHSLIWPCLFKHQIALFSGLVSMQRGLSNS